MTLGLVLLAAGGLKGYELATEPVVEKGFWKSRWFLIGLVGFELALGLWLISGWWAGWARRIALAAFSAFLVVALFRAAAGASSCACFGRLQVSPWLAASLDFGALAALLWWIPGRDSDWEWKPPPMRVLAPALILLVFLLIGTPLALLSRPNKAGLLEPSSPVIDMGEVVAGGSAEVQFTLRNPGPRPVEVAQIEAGCPCLTLHMPRRIEPKSEEVEVQARLDLGSESDFVGDLGIVVRGYTVEEKLAFVVIIKVEVRAGERF